MDFSTAIPPQITRALSNTFIYSLWQGVILAALAGIIILLTQKSASRKRYNLLIGLLIAFSVSVVSTFIYQLQQPDPTVLAEAVCQSHVVHFYPQLLAPCSPTVTTPVNAGPSDNSFIGYINQHAGTIVLIWFLIVCARCLQLLSGLHGLHRLRHHSVTGVGNEWEEKLQSLANEMGIKRIVAIAESGLAKVPMVIGHLKPLVLIPAGLITAMPPAEIETILIHELAHIRRRDYLVNLLQNFVEIIFFFNPAVLWVSSLIKSERENCCDDITLARTSSKAAYIRALISCQEYQSRAPRFAMALAKRQNLLGRVSRMVSSSNHSLSILEKSLLTVALITAGVVLAAFSGKEKKKDELLNTSKPVIINQTIPPAIQTRAATTVTLHDTTPSTKIREYQTGEIGEGTSVMIGDKANNKPYKTYLFKENGTLYQVNYQDGKLVSLLVNGKSIPAEDWSSYKPTVGRLITAHAKKERTGLHELHELPEIQEHAAHDADDFSNALNTLKRGGVTLDKALEAMSDSLHQLKGKVGTADYSAVVARYKADAAQHYTPADEYKAGGNKAVPANPQVKMYESNITPYQPKNEYKSGDPSYIKPGRGYKTGVEYSKPHDEKRNWITTDQLISYMVKEGLVARPQDVQSFLLSNEQLIVNGKQFPSDVHLMMLDKYMKEYNGKSWSVYYNFDTSTLKTTTRNVQITD